jgi:hypothetical protein
MSKSDCATTMHKLGALDSDLGELKEQFTALVECSNRIGSARVSSTLYKLIDDVAYLREVAPRVVAALSEQLTE